MEIYWISSLPLIYFPNSWVLCIPWCICQIVGAFLSHCSLHHEFRIQQFRRGNRLFGNSVLNLHELLFYFREFHRAGISFRAKYTTKAGATGIFLTWRSNANEFRAFRYACIGLGDVGGQSSTVNKKRCTKDLQFVKSLFKKTNLTFYAPLNPL